MDSMLFFGRDRVTSNLLILPLNYLQIFILFFTQSLKHWQISQKVKSKRLEKDEKWEKRNRSRSTISNCSYKTHRGKEITENVSETFSELRHTGCQTERIHEMHSKVDFYRLISHLTLLWHFRTLGKTKRRFSKFQTKRL